MAYNVVVFCGDECVEVKGVKDSSVLAFKQMLVQNRHVSIKDANNFFVIYNDKGVATTLPDSNTMSSIFGNSVDIFLTVAQKVVGG